MVEGVDYPAHVLRGAVQQVRDVRAAWPCADISTTIARRSLAGSRAVRPIRCSRCPSVIVTGPTNTSGGWPIATSENSLESSLAMAQPKINYTNKVPGRRAST